MGPKYPGVPNFTGVGGEDSQFNTIFCINCDLIHLRTCYSLAVTVTHLNLINLKEK